MKLAIVTARTACRVMRLVRARDGQVPQAARDLFEPDQIELLAALQLQYEGRTARRKIPIPQGPSPGLPGSSPASAAGKAPARLKARPAHLPCGAVSPNSTVSGMVIPSGRNVHRSACRGRAQ